MYWVCAVFDSVFQNFWDPVTKSEFRYNLESSTWNSSWWFGEPVGSFVFLTRGKAIEACMILHVDVGDGREGWYQGCQFDVVSFGGSVVGCF
jgi:hypothetical protein